MDAKPEDNATLPLFPKDRNFEGGDSPATTPSTHPAKRRRVGSRDVQYDGEQQQIENDRRGSMSPADVDDMPVSDISPVNPPEWQKTIEKVVKAIVSIRFSQVAAFDTEGTRNNM